MLVLTKGAWSPFFYFRALGALAFLGAWLIPHHILPWISWYNELLAFAGFYFLLAGACFFKNSHDGWRRIRLEIPVAALWFVSLMGVVIVQAISGKILYMGDAIVLTIYLSTGAFSIVLGSYRRDWLGSLSILVLAAALVSVYIALIQALQLSSNVDLVLTAPHYRRPGGNLGQANHLGTLMLWGGASAAYLALSARISIRLFLLFAMLCVMGIVITESRTALLGFICVFIWSYYYFLRTHFMRMRMRMRMLWIGWVILVVIFFTLWPRCIEAFHEGSWYSVSSQVAAVNTRIGTRWDVWLQLWEAVCQQPIFGWGLHGVAKAQNFVVIQYEFSESFTFAHNVMLDLAVGLGLPLATLFVSSVTFWLMRKLKYRDDVDLWFCCALLFTFSLHSMLEFPFAYAYFLLPVCFVAGVISSIDKEAGTTIQVPLWLIVVVGLFSFGLSFVCVRDYFLVEEDFRVARFEALRIGETPSNYLRPTILVLDQLNDLTLSTREVPAPNMTQDSIDRLRKTALRFPWSAIQNRYAMALALNGDVVEAQRQLKVIRTLNGEKMYGVIRSQWDAWGEEKYPQLVGLAPP